MDDEVILLRIERFERTVATCVCIVPLLFAGQCLAVSLGIPVFHAMFADFGSKLPDLTRLVFDHRSLWIALSLALHFVALVMARKASPTHAVVFATGAGVALFVLAQFVTLGVFLPILELGAVAKGM